MKKFIIGYMKVSAKLWVIYALVAWIGDWITDRHPLKDEGNQAYAKLLFAVMKMCVFSPYYTVKGIINPKKNAKVAE